VVHEKLWLKMYPDHNSGGIFDVHAIEQTFDIHDRSLASRKAHAHPESSLRTNLRATGHLQADAKYISVKTAAVMPS
jgi:hypothetical protein